MRPGEDIDEVEVPYGDDPSETATLLLAAAEEQGVDQVLVRTTSEGFLAPAAVAAAVLGDQDPEPEPEPEQDKTPDEATSQEETPKPAKKTAAKRS